MDTMVSPGVLRRLVLSLVFALAWNGFFLPAKAAHYYVDYQEGNNTNTGLTPSEAFKHCPGDPAATDKARALQLQAGDVVRFKGGVVYRGAVSIGSSGTDAKPIVFDGTGGEYGNGRAIIDGSVPIADLRRCENAGDALGNPNFRHIYSALVPSGARWDTLNVCQANRPLAVAQDPNPPSPIFQEDPSYYIRTGTEIPQTNNTTRVRALNMGVNSTRPLIAMFDGTRFSGVIENINAGGQIEIELSQPAAADEIAITPQPGYTNPKTMQFSVDGKTVLNATLRHEPSQAVEQRFKLSKPVTFRKMVVTFVSAHPGRDGQLRSWGAVQKIAAYDSAGRDVLRSLRTSTLSHEYFSQHDPETLRDAFLALYAKPAAVYYKRIRGIDRSKNQIRFDTLAYNEIPEERNGAFSIVNSLRHIDRPGEYALSLDPEPDGRHRLYLWPYDNDPTGLTHGSCGTGVSLHGARHVVIDGFWIRKQGWQKSCGIDGQRGDHVVIRDVKVSGLRGRNAGIHTTMINNLLVEDCEVIDNAGHTKGILLRNGENIVVRRCWLIRNSSTALDYYTVSNGVVQDCLVESNKGMHANGLTFYVGCRNILVERNTVRDGNVALTVQDGDGMIIRNNVLEGGRGGSPAIGLWSGRPYNNIVICHNVLRYYGEKTGGWTGAIYGGNAEAQGYAIVNNIIDGLGGMVLRKADLHHNMFTCFGAVMNEASLGDNLYEPDLSKVFVDAARGDYRLHPKALAIDYGTLVGTINRFDRVGVDRSQFGKPDIGPYEYVENGHSPETLKQADPSTFRFSMGGYTIRPAPEREIVYESPFKSVEDGEKHEMLGLDFTNEGGGKVATRPTRGGYICMWDKPGHWLEWTVEVDKPGFYELVLTFASEMPSKRSVLLNGKPVDRLEAVAFPATGAWRAFEKKGLPVALELVEGKNTIRFTNVTGSLNFRNLQFVQVVPPSEK